MKGEWMNGDSGVPIRDSPPFDSRRLLDRGIELQFTLERFNRVAIQSSNLHFKPIYGLR